MGQRALQDLRIQIFAHLQTLSIGFYSRNRAGVLVSRMTNDVEALDQLVTDGVVTLFQSSADADRHGGDPARARRQAGALTFLVVPAAAASGRWRSGSPRRTPTALTRERIAAITAYLQETLSGMRVVRAFAQEPRHQRRFAELNEENREANMTTVYLNAAYFPAVELLSARGDAVILVVRRLPGDRTGT